MACTFLVRAHAPKWLAFPQGKHVNNGLLIMGTLHSYFNPFSGNIYSRYSYDVTFGILQKTDMMYT